ncbi:MAG: efflux RND transporter permease subunit, partial [Salinisphaeraceae bacterium]|nr:efflux RND transporter permease subunit [Salinisphaeraceae bacterium]
LVKRLTEEGWKIPKAIRVDSVANFQHTRGEADDLIVEDLIGDLDSMTAEDFARAKEIALNEPLLVNNMVSDKGHVTAVNVRLEMPETRAERDKVVSEITTHVRELADEMRAEYEDIDIYLLGVVIVNTTFNESSQMDSKTLMPTMFVLIIVLLAWFLRSLAATAATIVIIISSVLITLGAMGWIGFAFNQVNVTGPTVILTIAICDAVHVLVIYLREVHKGKAKVEAMKHAMAINMQPVFLTSLTTAIGFASINFSDSPPFREMGTAAAIGVMGAWLMTLLMLPAAMLWLPHSVKGPVERPLPAERMGEFVIRNQKAIFWCSLVIVAVVFSFIPRNELNDDTLEYFDHTIPLRVAGDFTQENLTGLDGIGYSLESGESGGIHDPEFLKKVDAFATWYLAQPEVVHVDSFTDVIKRLNKNLHGDDPAYYRIPDERELIAQYVLLYELSLPFGLDLNNQVNIDKSALRLSVRVKGQKAQGLIDLDNRATQWLEENAPELSTHGSSVSMMFAHIGQNNIYSMIDGSLVALVLISLTLIVALRSWKFGLLSLIPNAFPAGLAFGIWGAFVAEVNLAVAAVFSITLGIVVDDTVHFLSKYLRARRELGKDATDAVRYAFSTVGSALLVTTVALAAGFFVLALSHFGVNSSLGLMVGMTIIIALVFDLMFLPTLLMRFDRAKPQTLA